MTKEDVKKILKQKMQALGFVTRQNKHYKILNEDYLIGVWLDHHPFCKAYYFEYGAIYLPDEEKMPFKGYCDWDKRFIFTKNPSDDLKNYDITETYIYGQELIDYFEYDIRSSEELNYILDINIRKRLSLLYDKEYVLNWYKIHLTALRIYPRTTVDKIIRLAHLNKEEIYRIIDGNGIPQGIPKSLS